MGENKIISFAYFDLIFESQKEIPKLILLANFTSDSKEEAFEKANQAKKALSGLNLRVELKDSLKNQEKYWLIRHKSFGLLKKYALNGRASPFIDDIIVKPADLPQFLPKLEQIIAPYKNLMTYTLAGHIGDGNFHIIPIMDLSKEEVRAVIPQMLIVLWLDLPALHFPENESAKLHP